MKTRRRSRAITSALGLLGLVIPMVVMIDLIAAIALARNAQIAANSAASACVRMAGATLEEDRGRAQGVEMGRLTLNLAGQKARDPQVMLDAPNGWDRARPISCRVQLTVPFGAAGLVASVTGVRQVTIHEKADFQIAEFKSRWSTP